MTDYRIWPEPGSGACVACGACLECKAFAEPVERMAQCSAAHFDADNPICRHYHAGNCGNFDGPDGQESER